MYLFNPEIFLEHLLYAKQSVCEEDKESTLPVGGDLPTQERGLSNVGKIQVPCAGQPPLLAGRRWSFPEYRVGH